MRILYLSQYFPPEVGATQTRAYEMARGLVRAGHQVTVLTEVANHPAGIVRPGFRRRAWVRRELEGIDVIHAWVLTSPRKTTHTRLAFYLSYMITATLAGLLLARRRYDVIYCTSPPLFAGGAGLVLSYLRRIPLVFEVRDLWPESAVALGELNNPLAIRLAAALADRCYRRSRRIVVVTDGIRRALAGRPGLEPRLAVIPNGANVDLFRPAGAAARTEARAALGAKAPDFVVIYAGILGLAQGLETVLTAADRLRWEPSLRFVLVGAGPREAALRAMAERLALPNVQFLGQQPRERMPGLLSAADLALVPLRDLPLFQGALPSKMFDAWACACPTLLTARGGEAAAVTETAGAGVVVPPEEPGALAETIRQLMDDRPALQAMGRRGRAFVVDHYARQAQAQALTRLLEQVVNGAAGRRLRPARPGDRLPSRQKPE